MNAIIRKREFIGKDYTVQTPSGARVLREIGIGLAHLRPVFAPPRPELASERLNFSPAFDRVHVAADGTFVNARHLWSIAVPLVKPGQFRLLSELNEILFLDRPDIHAALMKLFRSHDSSEPYWQSMAKVGWYDPATQTVHRHPRA